MNQSQECMHECVQVQTKLTEQQARTQTAEETIEALKKENGTMKGHAVKLKNALKEIERLREAWTDKDVQLAEANSNASSQRHVSSSRFAAVFRYSPCGVLKAKNCTLRLTDRCR